MKRPAGVKGPYKVVDPRMKKDLRSQRAKEKRNQKTGKKRRWCLHGPKLIYFLQSYVLRHHDTNWSIDLKPWIGGESPGCHVIWQATEINPPFRSMTVTFLAGKEIFFFKKKYFSGNHSMERTNKDCKIKFRFMDKSSLALYYLKSVKLLYKTHLANLLVRSVNECWGPWSPVHTTKWRWQNMTSWRVWTW